MTENKNNMNYFFTDGDFVADACGLFEFSHIPDKEPMSYEDAQKLMQEWEIWMEGYAATGESDTARLVAKIRARSFKEACDIHFFADYLEQIKKSQIENPTKKLTYMDTIFYDRDMLRYWACRLFDNETDARKSFG